MSLLFLRLPRTSIPVFASIALLTACGDGSDALGASGGATALSVSFNASTAASGAAATAPAGQPMIVASGADTLVINRVQMVVDEFEMEREDDDDSCDDSRTSRSSGGRSTDAGSCSRLDRGPFLLDLPLGNARSAIAVTVPAGRYEEFELELDAVDDSSSDDDDDSDDSAAKRAFLAANPAFRNVSVRVEGTYRGAPFVYTSRPEVEMEFEFEPALVVEAGVNDNITVSVDIASWFRTSTGAVVAPTTVNRSRIDANILSSFHAFGDRNRDGREDDGRGRSRRRGSDD